jgi:hypothetical protein
MRKNINTIWDLQKMDGIRAFSFRNILEVGTTHFQTLFKEPRVANIV